MTPYVLEILPPEDVTLFERIRRSIQALPDLDLGTDEAGEHIVLSCHILARAVAKVFSVTYVDGSFQKSWDHSWIVTQRNNIIDVYPVATYGGPLLIEGHHHSPARTLYTEESPRQLLQERFGSNSFQRSILQVTRELYRD